MSDQLTVIMAIVCAFVIGGGIAGVAFLIRRFLPDDEE